MARIRRFKVARIRRFEAFMLFCLFGLLAPLTCASSFHFSFVIVIVVVILAHIPNRELAQAT